MKTTDHEIKDSLNAIHAKLDLMSRLPCNVHSTRIKLLEKVVYGAVAIILIAFVTYLIPWSKGSNVKAEQSTIIIKDVK